MVNLNWQKYPVYKSSGVEWLGDIPEHWEVKRLKRLVKKIIDGTHFTPNYVDEGIPFLRVTDIHGSSINMNNVKYISQKEHEQLSKRCNPEKGDVLLSKNGTIGITKVVDWDYPFSIFVSLCLLKPVFQDIDSYFLSYIFQGKIIDDQILESSKTTSVTNLHLDKIQNLTIVVPPLSEQQAIANFLDEKTAQIDEYIAKKQRIIELLKEQKTVIINQAVTKGINPDVPMKYSGIEWLGEIPEHWEVLPAFAVFKEQCVINRDLVEKNLLSLSYGKIIRKSFTNNFGLLPESFETYQIVTPGNIILRLTDLQNDKRSLRVGLVKEKGIITSAYLCLNPQNVIPEYVYTLLHIYDILKIFYSMGSGVRQNMKFKDLKRLPITFPPVSEQKEIVSFIEKKLEKIERSLTVIEKEIKLTQEYRTTLISETVTGKIDVRKYHPPQ